MSSVSVEQINELKSRLRVLGKEKRKRLFLVDIQQLQFSIHTYFHADIPLLLNKYCETICPACNGRGVGCDYCQGLKTIPYGKKVIAWAPSPESPTTGQHIRNWLTWHDLHGVIMALHPWDNHVLRSWVGRPLPVVEGEEPWPKVTFEHIRKSVEKLIEEVSVFL